MGRPQPRTEDWNSPSIGDMKTGDFGWCLPWSMDVDADGNGWLRGDYPVHSEPGGTVSMPVERREDGWHVGLSEMTHPEHFAQGHIASFCTIPVKSWFLHWEPETTKAGWKR